MENIVSFYIVKAEDIKGFWTLKMSKKYDMDYFRKVSFKTFCALSGAYENSDIPEYVILEKDPFTDEYYEFFSKEQVCFKSDAYEKNFYPCIDSEDDLTEASLLEFGKIFGHADIETLKQLFKDFSAQNRMAYCEVEDLYSSDLTANCYDNISVSVLELSDTEALSKGTEIFMELIQKRFDEDRLCEKLMASLHYGYQKPKQYKIQTYPNKN